MSAAKTLNITTLAKSNKTVTLEGKEYKVIDMTVEDFVNAVAERDAAEEVKDEKKSAKEQIDEMMTRLNKYIPDVPREVLLRCSIADLGTILAFVQGALDVDAEGNPVIKDETAAPAEEGAAGNP